MVHPGPEVVVPDLVGWRKGRVPELPEDAWIASSPDWVREVLSLSTTQIDRGIKWRLYAAECVLHYGLIVPALRTLKACAPNNGSWTMLAFLKEDEPVALRPFAAVSFPPNALCP